MEGLICRFLEGFHFDKGHVVVFIGLLFRSSGVL